VPGLDVAGTVVAVGPDVTRLAVGDRVFGIARGSFAPYALALVDKLVIAPKSLTDPEAAVLGISGLTALQSLRDAGRLQAGQRVLILGASGGVGTYAVQIAKALGAEVTGVCSAAKADVVGSLGADHVLDYRSVDPVNGSSHYDLIIDIGGHRRLSTLRRALTPKGTLVVVGSETGGKWTGGIGRQFRAVLLSPFLRQRLTMLVSSENAADLQILADMAAAAELRPSVDSVVPLADAADAMRRLAAGEVRGKVAISVARGPN
jgi:NADPH:quinone reductase-like Zn-dependent oxidoreductase